MRSYYKMLLLTCFFSFIILWTFYIHRDSSLETGVVSIYRRQNESKKGLSGVTQLIRKPRVQVPDF